jgi:light-regulated signal transduction histidine kinase (bacteriophytochrome)
MSEQPPAGQAPSRWGRLPSGEPLDLSTCAREPIHIPGSIQPHGVLLAVSEPELRIVQVSANSAALLGLPPAKLLELTLHALLDEVSLARVRNACKDEESRIEDQSPLRVVTASATTSERARDFDAILHRSGGLLVVELEPSTSDPLAIVAAYRSTRRAVDQLDRSTSVVDLCARAAIEVRGLTGFDRVMVYRFDADWHGEVIAEAKREDLEPFLGLHYPASDIPEQARRLYALSTLRIIVDVDYTPAPLVPQQNPRTSEPLDLSLATLRSVSPIHCEYLRNMGVRASMSISLLRDGRLWGLIACHHYARRFVPYEVRLASELLGRSLSWQVSSKEHADNTEARAHAQSQLAEVVSRVDSSLELMDALVAQGAALMRMLGATGLVVMQKDELRIAGLTPPDEVLHALGRWLATQHSVFASDRLAEIWEPAREHVTIASGLLAITLTPGTVLIWLRPEFHQTVRWGRNPDKRVEIDGGVPRLTPLGSFGEWKEEVKGRSAPWQPWEIGVATDVRGALIGNVLRHSEERERLVKLLAKSNADLDQFAYVASHDLKAPLRGIANLSQWIEEDLGDALSGESKENMRLLRGRVDRLEALINGILDYSRAGKRVSNEAIDVASLLRELIELIAPPPAVTVRVHEPMPTIEAERVPLTQVFMNLIGNALKHAKREGAVIEIAASDEGRFVRFSVADNGPGIAAEFHERIWGIFQTLRGRDEVEGTGIGLSIVRKIVEARGGRAWVESREGHGATFFVQWPKARPEAKEQAQERR